MPLSPQDDTQGEGSVELIEQPALVAAQGREVDQPAVTTDAATMDQSAGELDLAMVEVDITRWPVPHTEAEDGGVNDEGCEEAMVPEDAMAQEADMERERFEADLVSHLLASGATADTMVRTLEQDNPAPGTVGAVVLELLRSGIEPRDILSQFLAAAESEVEAPPPDETETETERFLAGGAAGCAEAGEEEGHGDAFEEGDTFEDEEAAVAPPGARRRGRGMGRHRGTPTPPY